MKLLLGPDDLEVGEIRIVPYPAGKPPKKSLLVTRTEAAVRCYWNVCRHVPIPLDAGLMALDALVCNTHGAEYRAEDGRCVAGPCEGEHLEPVPIEQSDGQLFALL